MQWLFTDDPILINVYHGLMAEPQAQPESNDGLARTFLRYVGFGPVQAIYRSFGLERFAQPLYQDAFAAQRHE
jgi:hypothetical protein